MIDGDSGGGGFCLRLVGVQASFVGFASGWRYLMADGWTGEVGKTRAKEAIFEYGDVERGLSNTLFLI